AGRGELQGLPPGFPGLERQRAGTGTGNREWELQAICGFLNATIPCSRFIIPSSRFSTATSRLSPDDCSVIPRRRARMIQSPVRLAGAAALLACLAAAGCATTSPGYGGGYNAPPSTSGACYACGTVTRIEAAAVRESNVPNATG